MSKIRKRIPMHCAHAFRVRKCREKCAGWLAGCGSCCSDASVVKAEVDNIVKTNVFVSIGVILIADVVVAVVSMFTLLTCSTGCWHIAGDALQQCLRSPNQIACHKRVS